MSSHMSFSNQKPEELIEAILLEITRFSKQVTTDFRSARDDFSMWYSLPHPSGNGSIATSKTASFLVDELVERALPMRNLEGRVKRSDLKKDIGKEVVGRFINEQRDIDRRQADRLLSWAAKRAEGRCGTFRFYFPVRFTFQKEPIEIDLGPVKLKWLDTFRAANFGLAKEYLSAKADEEARQWSGQHLRRAIAYYQSYKWFAEVTVDGFDEEMAEDASYDVLTTALDCLYFLMGRKGTYRIDIGRFKIANDDRALIWTKPDGSMVVRVSSGSLDVMGLEDGWSKELERPDVRQTLNLITNVLEAKADLRTARPLANRFADSARWFGEGVRDRQPYSKIVKFITAIERLIVAGKTDDISETVSIRVADLTIESDNREDWERKKSLVKRAYSVRSELVHGSVSPSSSAVIQSVSICGDIVEETLYAMLHRLHDDGLAATDVSEKQYAEWFADIRKWVDALHKTHDTTRK